VSLAYLGPIYGLCLKQFHALDIGLETIKNPLSLWQTLMQSLASRYIKMKICFFMDPYTTPIHLLLVQRHSVVIEADLSEKKSFIHMLPEFTCTLVMPLTQNLPKLTLHNRKKTFLTHISFSSPIYFLPWYWFRLIWLLEFMKNIFEPLKLI